MTNVRLYSSSVVTQPPAGFRAHATLTTGNRSRITQGLAVDSVTSDIYVTQSDNATPENIVVSKFVNNVLESSMNITGGGHGDLFYVENAGATVYLRYRHNSLSGSNEVSGTWVRVPYRPGQTMSDATALTYESSPMPRDSLDRRGWWQGEAAYDGKYYRLYGGVYNDTGTTTSPEVPVTVEVVQGGEILSVIDAGHLGRVGDVSTGLPLGGRLEPQGAAILMDNGWPHLLVGIAINSSGAYQTKLYKYALTPAANTTTPTPVTTTSIRMYSLKAETVSVSTTNIRMYSLKVESGATNPIAFAGEDITVEGGARVTLTGTDNSSAQNIFTRNWKYNTTTLSTGSTCTFTVPLDLADKSYTITYNVLDSLGATASDSISVNVQKSLVWYYNSSGVRVPYVIRTWTTQEIADYNNNVAPPLIATTTPTTPTTPPTTTPGTGTSLRTPIATTAPTYTTGVSNNVVNPDRTTL